MVGAGVEAVGDVYLPHAVLPRSSISTNTCPRAADACQVALQGIANAVVTRANR